jgi:hypothetical protein
MADEDVYFARYLGALTPDDRAALERAGFKVYENGYGVSASFMGEARPDMTMFQVVRLTAEGPDDARQRVVDALGREPEDLRVTAAT